MQSFPSSQKQKRFSASFNNPNDKNEITIASAFAFAGQETRSKSNKIRKEGF